MLYILYVYYMYIQCIIIKKVPIRTVLQLVLTRQEKLWDELGYRYLCLTSQNVRDQAVRLEKTLGNVTESIRGRVCCRGTDLIQDEMENSNSGVRLIQC